MVRHVSQSEIEAIRRLKCEQLLTTRQIGAAFGVSSPTISYWLRKRGNRSQHHPPPVRNPSEVRRRRVLVKRWRCVWISMGNVKWGLQCRSRGCYRETFGFVCQNKQFWTIEVQWGVFVGAPKGALCEEWLWWGAEVCTWQCQKPCRDHPDHHQLKMSVCGCPEGTLSMCQHEPLEVM